ncbi:CHAT domain-containing protein [Streptacidiphilus sp. EB129]|uniref:CHAT domain-containing protein n=1 Tax=Streptacidiphilus sp. EB129 TaxID=3156262 RepID=UPI003512A77C
MSDGNGHENHGDAVAAWIDEGVDLMGRFAGTRDQKALRRAVDLFQAAARALPEDDPDRAVPLTNLVGALMTLHAVTRAIEPLREAVGTGRELVASGLPGHPEPAVAMSNLAVALHMLYEREADPALLDEETALLRGAVGIAGRDDPRRGGMLSNLATALRVASELRDAPTLLDEAVLRAREAVAALPPGERGGAMSVLATALRGQYGRTGNLAQLWEAVDLGRAAVDATPPKSWQRAEALLNSAALLRLLSARTGDGALLGEAVDRLREAVALLPPPHANRPPALSNLALALREAWLRSGELVLLQDACAVMGEAATAVGPKDFRYGGYLSNFCLLLGDLAARSGRPEPLAMAVEAGRRAVDATPPDHVGLAVRLDNLACALRAQAEHTGAVELLTEAVSHASRAVDATPPGHPERARYLGNLATVRKDLAGRTDGPEGVAILRGALAQARDAVSLGQVDDPLTAGHRSNLAAILIDVAERTGDPEPEREARAQSRTAAETDIAPPRERVRAYRTLARLLSRTAGRAEAGADGRAGADADEAARTAASDRSAALAAIEAAVELLPSLAARQLSRGDREYETGLLSGLPAQAAAAAVDAGQPARAVELLEQTRGILVADALDARSGEAARLRRRDRRLFDRFQELRTRIQQLESDTDSQWFESGQESPAAHGARSSRELRTDQRREARQEWDDLLAEIRAVPELADFLRPPDVTTLARAAEGGTVVYLYADPSRCDALLLAPGLSPVTVVPLPGLAPTDISRWTALLRRGATEEEATELCGRLWDAIAEPVLGAVDAAAATAVTDAATSGVDDGGRGTGAGEGDSAAAADPADGANPVNAGAARSEQLPRIWWCPVGAVAQLPLHAAGHHGSVDPQRGPLDGEPRRIAALDRAVSSYTPTARALADARARDGAPALRASREALVVAAPKVRPFRTLRGAAAESRSLRALIPSVRVLDDPRRAQVLDALPGSSVVHFAGHGVADPVDPGAGRLILADHRAAPLTVAAINDLQLTGATLAYLSACSTTATSAELADEAVHLTAAFHLAGFRGVIGTLWPVDDNIAYEVAVDVYTRLTDQGRAQPDYAGAALALHHAVRAQRREERFTNPTRWAAHLHTGA